MNLLTFEVKGADGTVRAAHAADDRVYLVYERAYEPGDTIVLRSARENIHLLLQLDDAMPPVFVYLTGKEYRFEIPFGEKRIAYSPKSFFGDLHVMSARLAAPEEIGAYRNLALNPYDQHANQTCFPHASANVETRGESVFAARNAINGNSANHSHGAWPFESWGINRRDDAEITIAFGRMVEIDKVVLTLRADFPHDNYWERVTLTFSDGSRHTAQLAKTGAPQSISLERRKAAWVTLSELVKSADPSPFPALSQIEVFGCEAAE